MSKKQKGQNMTQAPLPTAPTPIVRVDAGALDPAMLALMEQAAPTADFTRDDLAIPYLQIVQSLSPYVKRADPQYIAEAREGDIIDTLTHRLRPTATIIPVKFERNYTEWKPSNGPLVKQWFTDSTKYDACGSDFGSRTTPEGNEISPTNVYYILLVDDGFGQPMILSLGGTQAKKARRINSLIQSPINGPSGPFVPPMFARTFVLTTVPESGGPGGDKSWMGWKFEPGMFTLARGGGQALFAQAQAFRVSIESGAVRATPPSAAATRAAVSEDLPF